MTVATLWGAQLADGRLVDVAIDTPSGKITAVHPATAGSLLALGPNDLDLRGHLLLPSFVEPHAHLDKACTADLVANPTGDLPGAVMGWLAFAEQLSVEAMVERATSAAEELIANGTTLIRTHCNVGPEVGLRALEALLQLRRSLGDRADLQIVALFSFVGNQCTNWRETRAIVRDAVDADASIIVGGCPHLEPDPFEATRFSVELAAEFARPLDIHTDETLSEASLDVVDLALAAKHWPYGSVVASHCVSLGMQSPDEQRLIAELLAEAGVSIVTLPQTNLFLQGRNHPTATPRGLTALRALITAGTGLTAGADNVRDPFNLMGRSDPLETAALLVMAGHLTPQEAFELITAGGRRALGVEPVDIAPGSSADLVAVYGTTLGDVLARGDAARIVWHRGRMVSRTTVQRERFG